VIDQFFVHAHRFVVEWFLQLAQPEARMVGVCGDHHIPFGRRARGRLSSNLAHVSGHRPRGNELHVDIGAVFFVEGLSENLGALVLQSGGAIKVQGAFFSGGGDQIIQRRGGSNGKPLEQNQADD
jgi:hypothetical protein